MKLLSFLAVLIIGTGLGVPLSAQAGPGHDHGDAAPVATGPALPRFSAASETFELVGVLNGKQITLYLDRAADNTPVLGAEIELEMGGTKLKAEPHEDVYKVLLAAVPQPGVLPITATVTAGQELDLLAGELDLHEPAHADESGHTHTWKTYAVWAAAALAVLAVLAVLIVMGRRIAASRHRRLGAAA